MLKVQGLSSAKKEDPLAYFELFSTHSRERFILQRFHIASIVFTVVFLKKTKKTFNLTNFFILQVFHKKFFIKLLKHVLRTCSSNIQTRRIQETY